MIVEVSTLGNLDALAPHRHDPMKIFYPFGVAWHATIIPVPVLAGMAVAHWRPRWGRGSHGQRWRVPLSVGLTLAAVLAGLFSGPLIAASKGRVSIVGQLSSAADVRAMQWLRDHTPPDALILNYPGIEGDWAPVIAERRTVHFREQLFYIGAASAWALQDQLRPVFLDPVSPVSEAAIRAAGVDYVLVPQVVGRPESLADALRWRPPFVEPQRSAFAQAGYLNWCRILTGPNLEGEAKGVTRERGAQVPHYVSRFTLCVYSTSSPTLPGGPGGTCRAAWEVARHVKRGHGDRVHHRRRRRQPPGTSGVETVSVELPLSQLEQPAGVVAVVLSAGFGLHVAGALRAPTWCTCTILVSGCRRPAVRRPLSRDFLLAGRRAAIIDGCSSRCTTRWWGDICCGARGCTR